MVRLLAVQTAIAILKRAIALSRKLKPREWVCLAVIQAMLAALCFWGYQQSRKKQVQPQEVRSASFIVQATSVSAPTITGFSWNTAPTANQPFGGSITGTGFIPGSTQVFFCVSDTSTCYQHPEVSIARVYGYSSHSIAKNQDDDILLYTWSTTGRRITSVGPNASWDLTGAKTDAYDLAASGHVWAFARSLDSEYTWDDSASLLAHEWGTGNNVSFVSQVWPQYGHDLGGWVDSPSMYHLHFQLEPRRPLRSVDYNLAVLGNWWDTFLPRRESPFISQPSAPRDTSLLDVLQKLALLFQSIVLATGSIVASVLGVLGYLRGRAELKLKQLQIREMEIKVELLERERNRAIQEAERSRIILLS
jgi:hypothetical protein